MKALFVAWQDPQTLCWVPVGRLTYKNGTYRFVYTRGAKKAKESGTFSLFGAMNDLESSYVSDVLFPLFANRVLPKSRPEYREYLRWLGLSEADHNELEVLARSGGLRATDTLEIFPCPEPSENNNYVVYFFSHGLRHLTSESQERIKRLKPQERLFLLQDRQNPHDALALLLRTGDPVSIAGYCPRYYAGEFNQLLEQVGAEKVIVTVEQVNPDAPSQLRLLCKLVSPWPANLHPCAKDEFQALAN